MPGEVNRVLQTRETGSGAQVGADREVRRASGGPSQARVPSGVVPGCEATTKEPTNGTCRRRGVAGVGQEARLPFVGRCSARRSPIRPGGRSGDGGELTTHPRSAPTVSGKVRMVRKRTAVWIRSGHKKKAVARSEMQWRSARS